MRYLTGVIGLCGLLATSAPRVEAQRARASPVEVDRQGVLRWTATGREVALFGVNYAAPFAYDYQAIKAMGIDPKRAIDADVSHLARLGVDAYRIHVWDKEVTDSLGNLLANEHLDVFDYLLAKLEARGIKVILTPIAWWGPGYPAPDHPSPGFANRYTKPQMLVDPVARRASVRYVGQFVQHVNPYTRKRYGDDPNIIAMEIFNEPWHDLAPPTETTRYINEMVAAMRGAGLRKPIFYNISEHYTPAHGAAVCAANIQGVSAQWYPTGLVRGEALPGNPLPHVDSYPLPWRSTVGCGNKALMVYEFDGADVTVPVMYPAMARAFRGAGFQWATQFAYDPMAVAYSNTEYQTHFLNLIYTPAKAISFLIAGEVFRQTPRGFDAGVYPASETFGAFRLSYADRLSELMSDTLMAYTGTTSSTPPAPSRLRHVAGVGSSGVVTFGGTGAYFLDRLADGVWRLEVYPDAVPVADPHSRGNVRRTVTRVRWSENIMGIDLADLGSNYSIARLGAHPGSGARKMSGQFMQVRPGAYLLTRAGVSGVAFTPERVIDGRRLDEFIAPPTTSGATVVRHEPPPSVVVGGRFDAAFDIAPGEAIDSMNVFVRYTGWQGFRRAIAVRPGPEPTLYRGIATIPSDTGRTGTLEYMLTVYSGGRPTTFPDGIEGAPNHWDFTGTQSWTTRVVPPEAPIVLFDADRDRSRVVNPGYVPGAQTRSEWIAGSQPERGAWYFGVDAFGPTAQHVAFRTMLRDGTHTRLATELAGDPTDLRLRVRLRAQGNAPQPVQVALILADGSAWGTTLRAESEWRVVEIRLEDLTRVPLVLLPRPYPTFLPYDLTVASTVSTTSTIVLGAIEGLQWGFARAPGAPNDASMRIEIESVTLLTSRPR